MNPIGIMQGRLSPPVDGRIQSFPVITWRQEFDLARDAGLACIEWIYEEETEASNPLATDEGLAAITAGVKTTGVAVRSICADYYMSRRLVGTDGSIQNQALGHLTWLIQRANLLAARYMVLPFVDSSSVRSPEGISGLLSALKSVIPFAEQANLELHLETDLPPGEFVRVLQSVNHRLVRANYDIGNSASLGYDPLEELTLLGPWLGSVHVKDRLRGSHTVRLGTGSADFDVCFRMIRAADFHGTFILQAAREEGLSEVELAKRNRGFIERHWLAAESSVA